MAPLLVSLKDLGCEITYANREGYFPFTLHGHGFTGDSITVDISQSSQFLSALLIVSSLSDRTFTVQAEGTHGMSYIHMTCEMMRSFGVKVRQPVSGQFDGKSITSGPEPSGGEVMTSIISSRRFVVGHGGRYHSLDYQVEPDVSAACYFYAMSLLLGIPVLVSHVKMDSLQGDIHFLHILEQMGCFLKSTPEGIVLLPPADAAYQGVDADMSHCSDQAITLAALAPFAATPTTIRGIGHIRHQECDRMNAIVKELGQMGIRCQETEDSITIYPGKPLPAVINTYDDHRMAMGFSLIGLRSPGMVIDNPGCCRKTFENYFEVLEETVSAIAQVS
jgi:3-phosphoshikimate 1-carboxyvinyltransferase